GDASEDLTATFYYGDGSGAYVLSIRLAPQASTMVDMAMLIAEKIPDANGNLIPENIREGSASFASSDRRKRMTLVASVGTFDVQTATCGRICITCCAVSSPIIIPTNPLCPIGDSMQCVAQVTECTGNTEDFAVSSWSSSNSSVATINSSGVMTGVAGGTAT